MFSTLNGLNINMDNLEFEEEVKEKVNYENMEECPEWNGEKMPIPDQARVSTLTAVSKIGTEIDVQKICMKANIVPYHLNREGIIRTEVFMYLREDDGNQNKMTPIQSIRGSCKKDYIDKKKPKKPFFNAASIYFNIKQIDEDGHMYTKEPNLKIFHNGGIQMTGINSIDMGNQIVSMFVDEIKRLENEGENICKTPETLKKNPIKICLMNSDFSFPFYIKRDILCQILKQKFDVIANFESTNYQGVNIKMFWNSEYKNHPKFGTCRCQNHCNGKGNGVGEGQCKRITIAPFQTGKVIITGAQTYEQLHDAREFICNIVSRYYGHIHSDKVHKPKSKRKTRRISRKKLIHIPIHNIQYYNQIIIPENNPVSANKNILEYMTQSN
jgi:hypothetical protein